MGYVSAKPAGNAAGKSLPTYNDRQRERREQMSKAKKPVLLKGGGK